jgi:hypothetical protein
MNRSSFTSSSTVMQGEKTILLVWFAFTTNLLCYL